MNQTVSEIRYWPEQTLHADVSLAKKKRVLWNRHQVALVGLHHSEGEGASEVVIVDADQSGRESKRLLGSLGDLRPML